MEDSEQFIRNSYLRLAKLQRPDKINDPESAQEARNTLQQIAEEKEQLEYLKNLMNEKKTELAKNKRVLKPVANPNKHQVRRTMPGSENRFNNANSEFVFLV